MNYYILLPIFNTNYSIKFGVISIILFSLFFVKISSQINWERGAVRKNNNNFIGAEEKDPSLSFLCRGALNEYAACLCNEENEAEVEVACINAQFVDVAVFQHLNTFYTNAKKITFHGNNFQDLPEKVPLFGFGTDGITTVYSDLISLNLSANYIVNLHSQALKATPNIKILDLSNNEIVLTKENVHFLDFTPKLTHLYLRRAFTSVVNRTIQFKLMLNMFDNANLNNLELLDLSYNYLTSVPYNLGCSFPSLSILDLRQNLLQNIFINTTCLTSINKIDLTRNYFHRLEKSFRNEFANSLPDQSLLLRNSFYCDCKSIKYITWLKTTQKVRDLNLLTCSKASPADFIGSKLLEVPLHQLTCKLNLDATNGVENISFGTIFIFFVFSYFAFKFF